VSRSAKVAILVSGLVLVCLAGSCVAVLALGPALPSVFGCRDAKVPAVSAVRDTPTRVQQQYPKLAGIAAVHWQERELTPRTCPDLGPMDYELAGVVVLDAAQAASYREQFTWTATDAPDVRPDLRPFTPASPSWQRSVEFDREIAGDSTRFVLDPASATLYLTRTTS
jgi:hypothetical protein